MSEYIQQPFPFHTIKSTSLPKNSGAITNNSNGIDYQDESFHTWYRFVLSFPPHLVRDYIEDFNLNENTTVLDPFCGTGTTLVESKLNHIPSIGLEANPFPNFASRVKVDWQIDPSELQNIADEVIGTTYHALANEGIDDRALIWDPTIRLRTLNQQASRALITNSISPLPLHKTLVLIEQLEKHKKSKAYQYGILALGNALVTNIGNLRFGPEVGVGKIKKDAPVVSLWHHEVKKMIRDLQEVNSKDYPQTSVFLADAREISQVIKPNSIDAVITSPPYPNEKDYTRTTRLESVILGFFTEILQIRTYKKQLLRSNTRGIYKVDDDDKWIENNQRIQDLAATIENRRIELDKTSGFERLYSRVTKLYFGGMAKHLSELTHVLKPGAKLAYVVGDQASYLRVLIQTGELLGEIAEDLGYKVERIDLFRQRFATATQTELREEVLVLRWPGK